MAGLPLWIFSPWNVPPHGSACAGQWAMRPSPVMIGHLVGCASKHLMMRQLGWWHYEVSAADALLSKETAQAGGRLALKAAMAAPAALGAQRRRHAISLPRGDGSPHPAHAPSLQAHAFPEDARALVLRRHALRMASSDDVAGMWLVIRRFCMLALALGRRAVLPLVPCVLSPCAPRVPNPLRSSLSTISLGDPVACREDSQVGSPSDLMPRPVDSPLGWHASPDTSKWWGTAIARRPHPGCCQPIPHFYPCIDPAGARRPLGAEPLISTADLVRLLEEAGSVAGEHNKVVVTTSLGANWTEDSLDAMRKQAAARVLVLDAGGQPMARLPSIQWLISQVSGTAAEEAIGHHAARCFTALGRG